MKKLLTILAALIISASNVAQAQDCLWAKSAGGTASESGNGTCTDASGNIYVTGSFTSPTITFGTITLTNSTQFGLSDIYIVKYSTDGTVLWAKSEGGSNNDNAKSICTDTNGNFYIAGNFSSDTLTFGTISLVNSFISFNSPNVFIVKYDPNGNVLWAKSAGGTEVDQCNSITADVSGNVYITGYFESDTITFGASSFTNANFIGFPSDVFIAKYSTDGDVIWAKAAGSTSFDMGQSVSTDASGNVYVTGYYGDSITFGTNVLTNSGVSDVFLVKYNPDGTELWAKSLVGAGADNCYCASTDLNGNVFITGTFNGSMLSFGSITLNSSGNNNIFLAKIDSDGIVLWAKSAGNQDYLRSYSISTDPEGNIYLSGNLPIGITTFDTTTLTNPNETEYDIFIIKFSSLGTILWANSSGGNRSDGASGVCTDLNGNVYLTGSFSSPTITFGTTTLTNPNNSLFNSDIYIVKYSGVSTGTSESSANNQLIISPNPTNSSITLSMPSLKNSKVSITTLTGTEVGNYNTENTSTQTIDISHLASGVYFVSLKSEEGVLTKKIIKQ
ncbi:MAG: SBBP repeat-containing protein [Bacteroidota bacterium]